MDPLSIAASVAGLLSLALQLVELGTKCSSRFLKAQLYEFVFELNALSDVLKRLKGFLDDPTTALTFSRISVFVSTNTRCKILLEELLAKLQETIQEPNKVKKAVDRVLWPFNEKEHRISMEKIHRYTQIFTFALTIEGCSLLSQSVREVTVALQEQEKKLKETKKLCGSIPNLITQIEQSLDQISSIQALVYALPDHSQELSVISDDISLLKSTATRQKQQIDESQRSKVLSWLSPATFEAKQRQLQERHELGTGAWFLRHDTFIQWKSERGSTLWCAGIPGAGKTFMASLIIETLRQSGYSVAFVFADYKEHMSNTKVNLISSLTRQLASQNQRNMDAAYSRYTKRLEQSSADDADPLTFEEHSEILQEISTNSDRIFVIVDAVDELPNTDEVRGSGGRAELLNALAQLHNVSKLFTTRPHIDAASFFPNFLQLDIAAKDQDLRTFLKARMSAAQRLSRILAKDRYLENHIIQTITSKSSGMFLLAQLQIEEVKTALSVRQVRAVLESLSGHLSDMYEKTIDRIKSQSSIEAKLGLRAISWIANVKRPLAMSEFVHAISLEQNDDHVDNSSLIDIQFIFETCGGLVQLQPASFELGSLHGAFTYEESVGFVHYTIQEYLDSCNLSAVNVVHGDIANTSLSYLCLRDFRQRTKVSRSLYPFLAYAAPFWPAHAEAAGDLLRWDLVELLINETRPHLGRNWLDIALHEQLGPSSNIPLGFAGAAVAIHGAHSILRFMLDKGLRVDVRFRTVLNPVKLALSCLPRHEDCIKLLMHSVSAREDDLVRDGLANLLEQILYASRYTKHADDQLRSFLSDESSLPSQNTHKVFEAAIGRGWEYLPQILIHHIRISIEKTRRGSELFEELLKAGNLPFLTALLQIGLNIFHFREFRHPIILSLKYRQPEITRYLITQTESIECGLVRFALEWFLMNLFMRYFEVSSRKAAQVHRILRRCSNPLSEEGKKAPIRTFPWLTCDRLLYLCRHINDRELDQLVRAVDSGLRPIDVTLLHRFLKGKPQFETCCNFPVMVEHFRLIERILLEDHKVYLAKIIGPDRSFERHEPLEVSANTVVEIRQLLQQLEQNINTQARPTELGQETFRSTQDLASPDETAAYNFWLERGVEPAIQALLPPWEKREKP